MMSNIIGRKEASAFLQQIAESGEPEFVAVFGRRRIGKTFLIKQFFENNFTFYFSGSENSTKKEQLENFRDAFQNYFKMIIPIPESWTMAFQMLRTELESSKKRGRKVIFFDEIPWIATKGSHFIQAFEYWWNTYASTNPNILLIICGSSTSWMINKILKNRGGLHNRVTRQIALEPFTLKECELLLQQQKITLDRQQILDYYMAMGGVPYYWKQINKSFGLPQNIDNMFFTRNAILKNEFFDVYNSLFKNSEKYIQLVIAISEKKAGLTREEIIEATTFADGGSLTRMLEELEQCGFIRSYFAFGKKERKKTYQLVDLFSLFYLNFLHQNKNNDEKYWTRNHITPKHYAWKGYAFEQVCLWHIPQIKHSLGIGGVSTTYSSWRSNGENPEHKKYQIDLVIDRNDHIINLCEMKYSDKEYSIDKDYNDTLRRRKATFTEETKTRKTVHTTMITTYGVNHNSYWGNVQSEVRMDDLFAF
ncbi:MAG: ATP-binding protein [Dysgonamonadaceae bacterium]|jgi:AAA+ ATPase superfamily predicted ATPase|nr:ATP-binding protein [Dysgonamonadaceae bacterium]